MQQSMTEFAERVSAVLDYVEHAARTAAAALQESADGWMLRPAAEFRTAVEHRLVATEGDVRLCLIFLALVIKDIMQNFSGDVPYDILGQPVDAARANVHRALQLTLRTLADELASGEGRLPKTLESCSSLGGEYFTAVERLNKSAPERLKREERSPNGVSKP